MPRIATRIESMSLSESNTRTRRSARAASSMTTRRRCSSSWCSRPRWRAQQHLLEDVGHRALQLAQAVQGSRSVPVGDVEGAPPHDSRLNNCGAKCAIAGAIRSSLGCACASPAALVRVAHRRVGEQRRSCASTHAASSTGPRFSRICACPAAAALGRHGTRAARTRSARALVPGDRRVAVHDHVAR